MRASQCGQERMFQKRAGYICAEHCGSPRSIRSGKVASPYSVGRIGSVLFTAYSVGFGIALLGVLRCLRLGQQQSLANARSAVLWLSSRRVLSAPLNELGGTRRFDHLKSSDRSQSEEPSCRQAYSDDRSFPRLSRLRDPPKSPTLKALQLPAGHSECRDS